MKTLMFSSRTGCLLPLVIFFNLFFGWIFFPTRLWLAIEGILILLFFLNSYILLRHFSNKAANTGRRGRKGVIDVEGKVIKD